MKISGQIVSETRVIVSELYVQLVDINLDQEKKLGDLHKTNPDGSFEVEIPSPTADANNKKEVFDLQVQVFLDEKKTSDDDKLGESNIAYNVIDDTTLNIILDDKASENLPTEYEALLNALYLVLLSLGNRKLLVRSSKFTEKTIVFLSAKSGWDRALIDILVLADKLGGSTKIDTALFYAMFRAGFPTEKEDLFRIEIASVEKSWRQAMEKAVIPTLDDVAINKALDTFGAVAVNNLMSPPKESTQPKLGDMLSLSGLNQTEQNTVGAYVVKYGKDTAGLTKAIEEDPALKNKVGLMKLNNQLSQLTENNPRLIDNLHKAVSGSSSGKISDPKELVKAGYYEPDAWVDLIDKDNIPAEYQDEDASKAKQNYAAAMASQLKQVYGMAQ